MKTSTYSAYRWINKQSVSLNPPEYFDTPGIGGFQRNVFWECDRDTRAEASRETSFWSATERGEEERGGGGGKEEGFEKERKKERKKERERERPTERQTAESERVERRVLRDSFPWTRSHLFWRKMK